MSAAASERFSTAEGLVLDRQPAGEHHLRLAFLTAEQGLLQPFWRISRTQAKQAGEAPDLFDDGEFALERARQGDGQFVKEFRLEKRRGDLARNYAGFKAASRLAAFVARNAGHLPETAALLALTRTALDCLAEGAPAEVVHFKALVRICQDEGYAVREQWLQGLEAALATQARNFLATPLADLPSELPDLRLLLESLEHWMRRGTDFYLDP
ncbi:MAG: hypothetical protein ACFBZ8_08730 [Opitutales bacterium]